jgi:hypothetical protein
MCKALAPHATIIATADDANHEQRLRAEGAGAVVRVYEVAADSLAEVLSEAPRARRRTDAVVGVGETPPVTAVAA